MSDARKWVIGGSVERREERSDERGDMKRASGVR